VRRSANAAASKTPRFDRVLWILLSACGSAILMVTTGQLLQNVASVPLLWVLPLVLYLMSFVVCFGLPRFYRRWLFALAYSLAVVIALIALYGPLSIVAQIAAYMYVLWICCCICHGELFRAKPPVSDLSHFYMAISVGGALGGVTSALVAPYVLADQQVDFVVGLFSVGLLFALQVRRDRWQALDGKRLRLVVRMQVCAFVVVALIGLFASSVMPTRAAVVEQGTLIAQRRNFYGSLQIFEKGNKTDQGAHRLMVHGNTMHGVQFLDSQLRTQPTSYFSVESGVGKVIRSLQRERGEAPMHVGVIGLGVGTLAAYGRPKDEFTFFELDKNVVTLCEQHFTYLSDARAKDVHVDVLIGDGRIRLEQLTARNRAQRFDVLVIDAFSGDAVPCHLLTKQCVDVYWEHVKPHGALMFNVTNRYVNLAPVVKALADVNDRSALLLEYEPRDQRRLDAVDYLNGMGSRWIVITDDEKTLRDKSLQHLISPWNDRALLWTDDHYSLLQVIR
jgi:protein-L-isoaspartate O-methyltransferase